MTKRITISDVARESGFSESTVSLVINNSPKISQETRSKVLNTIERYGYRPNMQARGLALKSSRVVSVVVPDIPHVFADPYFGEIISGIHAHATEQSFKVLIDIANMNFIRTQEYLNLLTSQRSDGLLFIGSTLYDHYLNAFADPKYAFVLVNNYFPDSSINFVAMDYKNSARLTADYLLGLGHRAIGSINGTNIQTALDFQTEFDTRLRDAGIPARDMPWSDGRFSEGMGYEAAKVLMTLNPGLTALMGGNEKMAVGAMRFLKSKNLRIPEDVSIMHIEDVPASPFISPKLTNVRHNLYELGVRACRNLIQLSRAEITQCHEVLPVEIAIRESCAPPAPKKG